ncbi:hypothetical protein [Pacificoceanicola onchidii]|uniref:hypothetical protein n=1 Tax=Pacificoceanicola onchidii TaxID=2562685 RepID=UPI0010A54650|nr:hypothetical protein [Pacificoceanicola onchidii]
MSERYDIEDYTKGEALPFEMLAQDGAGVAVTAGDFVMRIRRSKGGAADVEVTGVHSGDGLWLFNVSAAQMAAFEVGKVASYQIWDTANLRVFLEGGILIGQQIDPAT